MWKLYSELFMLILGAFSHLNRGVVVFPEHLEELSVVGDLRVEVDLNRLGVVALFGKNGQTLITAFMTT